MHLIATIPGGWNPNDEGVFYIEQDPGDIIFLSAADTELFTMNKAYHQLYKKDSSIPSLRLANLTYFKQELTIDTYIDEVVSKAKIVVLKLLGGTAYFSYLCEALQECAEEYDIQLIFLPGDNQPDLELMQLSTCSLEEVTTIWNYFLSGGLENTTSALQSILTIGSNYTSDIQGKVEIPTVFVYHPKTGIQPVLDQSITESWCLVLSYRSYYLADNLEPIDQLITDLERKGVPAFALMALSYRDENCEQQLIETLNGNHPATIINTTGFSLQSFNDRTTSIFDRWNVPVIQAIMASCNRETWKEGLFGLPPTDIAMQIALPELDSKIISSVVSFKESNGKDALTDSEIIQYHAHKEGSELITDQAKAWIELQKTPNSKKRIAVVLPNYPTKNSRLANGVGLDTPESTVRILSALAQHDFSLDDRLPATSNELIDLLTSNVTNDLDTLQLKGAEISISESIFLHYYDALSSELKQRIEEQWGAPKDSPNYRDGVFVVPGVLLGNIFLSIQPSRGYNLDLEASYHSPDLPPTFAYLAYYCWIHQEFNAQAIIHVGKHGNLEWLPGKSVALDPTSCFPAAILKPIPHFYPFIINDPGEGTQAKRRTHAIILDHLIPPMTRAENHGELLKLELLIDEYYEAALLDPKRSKLLKQKIDQLVSSTHLKSDLNSDSSSSIEELLEAIDGYLCELKEAQIRGGLHIYGQAPQEEKLTDLIVAIHRLPQGDIIGITQAIASDLQLDFDPLNVQYEATFGQKIDGIECRTFGQAIEVLETKASIWIAELIQQGTVSTSAPLKTTEVLTFILSHTLPVVQATTHEITNLINGLNGNYIPAGGSGAPTRGRLDILPTGRNFYSVDVRTIPSESAYELGVKSANNVIDRYLQENGEYPNSIGLSVWGTSTMRTGGDDLGQAFALIGVRPIWQGVNRRVKDFEVISLLELKRPRVDVMLRISGFFRDAFPDAISFFNAAIERVAQLDEPLDQNPIRARHLEEKENWIKEGLTEQQAEERSLFRVFGSKPGAYGAGLQGLIDEKNWTTQDDLARAYMNWSGYAYHGRKNEGKSAHETFKKRLATIDVVLQNQDNREHDILDSDDYYQFQGGLTAAVTLEKGSQPETYFGDHSRPENPRIKTLKEEIHKVYRSRVINPKWIQGMQDHGYKGAFEMAATMDYLFAYDATTQLVEDFMYEGITNAYLMDEENQAFIEQHNPWALKDMSERMLEAIQRGLWQNPSEEIVDQLKNLYLQSENALEL